MKQTVLVLSHSHLANDPRVFRQIRTLRESYRVISCGFSPSGLDDVEHISLDPEPMRQADKLRLLTPLMMRNERLVSSLHPSVRATTKALKGVEFDLILVNDAISLPAVAPLLGGRRLYFDAHEYAPLEFEEKASWRFFWAPYYRTLCRKFLPHTHVRTTVCETIAHRYEKEFGFKFELIKNLPNYVELEPSSERFEKIRLIHHGAAIRGRQLEIMAEIMRHLPSHFELTFMLVPTDRPYFEELKSSCSDIENIHFIAPVPMPEISRSINQFDLGIFLLPENSFNNKFALPNKFFEFVQARLGIICSPSPEMSSLVNKHGLGLATSSLNISEMAEQIAKITKADIRKFKANSQKMAPHFSYEAQRDRFLKYVKSALQ